MSENSKLTAAQKGAATRAAKAEKQRQEDIAFIAANMGPRQAMKVAKKNAIWKGEPSTSRKRTSSTVQASEVTKKARETAPANEVEDDEDDNEQTKEREPKTTSRKYAAPIDIDSDSESEAEEPKQPQPVHIDFTNLPSAENKTRTGKAKSTAKTKAVKAAPAPTKSVKVKATTVPTRKVAKIVAESSSDDASDVSGDNSGDADHSDEDAAQQDDDEGPNAQEFVNEVPQVVRTKTRTVLPAMDDDSDGSESDKSREIDDVAPRKSKSKGGKKKTKKAKDLFKSDEDVAAPPKRSVRDQARDDADSDIMMDEAIADELVSIPLYTQSRRGSTASGWSSGRDLTIPNSEPESDVPSEPEVPQPRKAIKVSAARQKKADLEKPEVRPAPTPTNTGSKVNPGNGLNNRSDSSWDTSTQLVLPGPNKDIGLTAQRPEVQLMLRGTIEGVKAHLFLDEFYPVMGARVGWIRPKMVTVTESNPSMAHVRDRLLNDPQFAAILAPIPLDRINIQRGDIKRCVVPIIMVMYSFAGLSAADVKIRVAELLKDHRYIFPLNTTGQMQLTLPFHHTSIKYVLKEQMMTSSIFKGRNYERLPARHPKHPDAREVSDPMVAMAATAVYACLLELRTTGERQPIAFTEEAFEDIYRIHIKTLTDTRASAPIAMHKVLHQLFRDVTTTAQASQSTAGSSATLINLVDIPESD
ncbi:hypothetical protein B0H12DRAFT_1241059 [Mycena haematopus]|nr:hypothetical protein B0H12DRAFT_1241059 [Mycena haematopus]